MKHNQHYSSYVLASCMNLPDGVEPTVENVCKGLRSDQQLITLFSENHVPVNCRSSLEGVWQFAYQNRFRFTGECNHPDAQIRSCQTAGTQFLITNQKFNITYKQCSGMKNTFDGGNVFATSTDCRSRNSYDILLSVYYKHFSCGI